MSATTTALSAQEQAIHAGKKVVHGTATDRIPRMFEAMRAYGPPRVALERAVLFTESFKETKAASSKDPFSVLAIVEGQQ